MSAQRYEKFTIEQFGRKLIESGDLDPIYIALHNMVTRGQIGELQLKRFLLVYWCFYSAGLACYLSELQESSQFWAIFMKAAANKVETPCPIGCNSDVNGQWPRAKERRHFRGQQAIKATTELMTKYPEPEQAFAHLIRPGEEKLSFKTLSARVQEWRGFGDWISYKVADMLDRLGLIQVDFAFDDAMYKDPTEAALMQWKVLHGAPQEATVDQPKAAVTEVVNYLLSVFRSYKAPPRDERPIDYQEIETILCKWKSHMKGHYPISNDLHEIAEGTIPWMEYSETAVLFMEAMPAL